MAKRMEITVNDSGYFDDSKSEMWMKAYKNKVKYVVEIQEGTYVMGLHSAMVFDNTDDLLTVAWKLIKFALFKRDMKDYFKWSFKNRPNNPLNENGEPGAHIMPKTIK